MKKILFIGLLFASCRTCPPIIESNTIDSSTTRKVDTVYVYRVDTVNLPPVTLRDTINLSGYCDSLIRGLNPSLSLPVKGGKFSLVTHGNKTAIECQTDSLEAAIVLKDAYIHELELKNIREKKTQTIIQLEKSKFDSFTNWWFFITAAFIAIFAGFKMRGLL